MQSKQLKLIRSILSFTTNVQVRVEKELSEFGLTIMQYQVLSLLSEAHPLRLALIDLRKRMNRRTSDFTRLIDKLIDKDMVNRFECPKDRRRSELEITNKGINTLQEISDSLFPIGKELIEFLEENSISINEQLLASINNKQFAV